MMRSRSVAIWVMAMVILLAGNCAADDDVVGTWTGTLDSVNYTNGGTLTNWVVRSNGTTEGDWTMDIGGGVIVSSHATGTYTYVGGVLTATYTGTAIESGYGTSTGYTLTLTIGVITSCDNAAGNYNISFDYAFGWPSSDSGTWDIDRTSMPSQVINPSPSNGGANQSIDVDLSWNNGGGACTFDVYFGTDPTPDAGEFEGNQGGTTYDPETLLYGTTYYWQINAVNTNGTTTGTAYNFTTELPPLPAKATNPNPSNEATEQSIDTDVSWSDGGGATNYNVYFGTDPTPDAGEFEGNQSGTTYDPGILAYNTTYYWRIDAKNSGGTTTGDVWEFATEQLSVFPDLNNDLIIAYEDVGMFSVFWMDQSCSGPDWCEGSDLNMSGAVDHEDLLILCNYWLTDIADPYLVAHWSLDENASNTFVSDISGNGHDGTATTNTSILSVPGQVDTCFDLAGTDAVEIDDDDALSFVTDVSDVEFSVVAWVYATTTGNAQMILSKWDFDAQEKEWMLLIRPDGTLNMQLVDDNSDGVIKAKTIAALSDGWHFVAATYNATMVADGITLYVDNVEVAQITGPSGSYTRMRNTVADVYIGARAYGGIGDYFADKIDDVQLYSKCLTAIEISNLYSISKAPFQPVAKAKPDQILDDLDGNGN